MALSDDIESIRDDLIAALQVGSERVAISQKELLFFGLLLLLLNNSGVSNGDSPIVGEGSAIMIDNQALAAAIAQALEAVTLTVTGDAINEATLANVITGNTQPISAQSLPLPTGATTEATLLNLLVKLPSTLVADRLKTDGSGVIQPVSAVSLPLPEGAGSEETLLEILSKLPTALANDRLKIDGSAVTQPASVATLPLPTGASTEATLANILGRLPSALDADRVKVDGSGTTQPISVASLPLPSGATTEATLSTLSAKLPSALVNGRLSVDGSAVTQPVSAATLPLPAGAATETTLGNLSAKLPANLVNGRLSVDASGVTQPISAATLPLPTGAATESTLSTFSAKLPSALVSGRLSVDGSGVIQPISAAALPLPTGAATSVKQPAIGVAGTPSADVISIQGVVGGIAQSVAQSGNWLLRLQDSAGNGITSQVSGSQRAIDVQQLVAGVAVDPRAIRALTSADIVSHVAMSKRVSATFTRPADTTAYAAGDAMGSSTSAVTNMEFPASARVVGGTGIITKARLVKTSTNLTNAAFRLWLFSNTPVGANDNAAYSLLYASSSFRLGYIDFPAFVTEGAASTCSECEVLALASQYYCAAQSIWGVLVARAAYVPTSGEQFFVELTLEHN